MATLPDSNDTGAQWLYDVTAAPKYARRSNGGSSGGDTVSRKVLKIWNDEGREDERPEQVSIQLLCNGEVYDTVTLSEANHWQYIWNHLDGNSPWTVVEWDVPGYTVSVVQEGRPLR